MRGRNGNRPGRLGATAVSDIPSGIPWPMPQELNFDSANLSVDPHSFQFTTTIKGCDIIDEALKRYQQIAFPHPKVNRHHEDNDFEVEQEEEEDNHQRVRRHKHNAHKRNDNADALTSLTVIVDGPCEKYPYFGMNENCKLSEVHCYYLLHIPCCCIQSYTESCMDAFQILCTCGLEMVRHSCKRRVFGVLCEVWKRSVNSSSRPLQEL